MDTLWQDIRYGARLLVRFPGVTAAALLALALGTGVNTALFSIVNTVLLQPLPFPDADELVQVWRTEPPTLEFGSASYRRYVDWRARNRVFEETGAWAPNGFTMTGREAAELVARSACVSLVLSRHRGAAARRPLVHRRRGSPGSAPRGGRHQRAAVAAARRIAGDPRHDADARRRAAHGGRHRAGRLQRNVAGGCVGAAGDAGRSGGAREFPARVRPHARAAITLAQTRRGLGDLAVEMSRTYPDDQYGFNALALHDVATRGPRQALWILLGTTAVVLLIACANVANLLLARAITRQREMAVRTALGAGRGRLLRQLITETLLLSLGGGAARPRPRGRRCSGSSPRSRRRTFPRLAVDRPRSRGPRLLGRRRDALRLHRRHAAGAARRAGAAERRAARGLDTRRHCPAAPGR